MQTRSLSPFAFLCLALLALPRRGDLLKVASRSDNGVIASASFAEGSVRLKGTLFMRKERLAGLPLGRLAEQFSSQILVHQKGKRLAQSILHSGNSPGAN